jgi:hypothetical protein
LWLHWCHVLEVDGPYPSGVIGGTGR